jgi:hypothetical protein
MAKQVTLKELATQFSTETPVMTLNLSLDRLKYQRDEQLKLKNALQTLNQAKQDYPDADPAAIETQVNALLDAALPYHGISIFAPLAGDEISYLPRNSVQTVQSSIINGPDFLSILKEQANPSYTLLQLSQTSCAVYALADQHLTKLTLKDFPSELTDALGTDLRGGDLNFSTSAGQTQYHGHNDTSHEKAVDQERYYHAIVSYLDDSAEIGDQPIILTGLPNNLAAFRQAAGSQLNLASIEIPRALSEKATANFEQTLLTEIADQEKAQLFATVNKLAQGKTVTEIDQVNQALTEKKVTHLIVNLANGDADRPDQWYHDLNQVLQTALQQSCQIIVIRDEGTELATLTAVTRY